MSISSSFGWLTHHFFGRVKKNNRKTYYACFLPVFKIVIKDNRKIYRLLGIRVFSKKKRTAMSPDRVCDEIRDEIKKQNIAGLRLELLEGRILNYHLCNKLHHAQDYILLFDSLYDKDAEAIDAWSMFMYLQSRNIPSKYVLKRDNKLAATVGNHPDVILVKDPGDLMFRRHDVIAGACCVLASFGLPPTLDMLLRRLPFLRYIFIEHGVIYLGAFAMSLYHPSRFDNIVAPTRRTYDLYCQTGEWSKEDIILNGIPRWDLLSRQAHEGKNIFIFFTWRKTFIKEPRKATTYFNRIRSFLANPEFRKLVKENNLTVNVAFHHALMHYNVDIPSIGDHVHIVDASSISRHIGTTDLLITDYSSISFDFMFLNIPAIFYRFDANDNSLNDIDIKNANAAKSLDSILYNCVYQESAVLKLVEHYISNDFTLEEDNIRKNEAFFWEKKDIRKNLYEYLERMGCAPSGN